MGTVSTLVTAEQLQEIAGDRRCELVRGEIVDMSPPAMKHGVYAIRLGGLMDTFAGQHNLGVVGTEFGVVLGRNPDTVRAPDLSFVAAHRISDPDGEGYFEGAPDLAVEILSPGDRKSEVYRKLSDYFEAGTRLVWVLDPRRKQVVVHHPDGSSEIYSGDQEVPGEDVLPGFSFRPAQIFSR